MQIMALLLLSETKDNDHQSRPLSRPVTVRISEGCGIHLLLHVTIERISAAKPSAQTVLKSDQESF